jgi:hypothetical protein
MSYGSRKLDQSLKQYFWQIITTCITQELLSLRDLIKSHMRQYTTQTCSSGPDDWSLTDTSGGYHHGAPNFRSDHSSSFPSSILYFPLIVPSSLQLCQPFDHFAKPHKTSIDKKGPITSGFQPLVFYR